MLEFLPLKDLQKFDSAICDFIHRLTLREFYSKMKAVKVNTTDSTWICGRSSGTEFLSLDGNVNAKHKMKTDLEVFTLLNSCTRLKRLTLFNMKNLTSKLWINTNVSDRWLHNLTHLQITTCDKMKPSKEFLQMLCTHCHKLTHLIISNCDCSFSSDDICAYLRSFPQLKHFQIGAECDISDFEYRHLCSTLDSTKNRKTVKIQQYSRKYFNNDGLLRFFEEFHEFASISFAVDFEIKSNVITSIIKNNKNISHFHCDCADYNYDLNTFAPLFRHCILLTGVFFINTQLIHNDSLQQLFRQSNNITSLFLNHSTTLTDETIISIIENNPQINTLSAMNNTNVDHVQVRQYIESEGRGGQVRYWSKTQSEEEEEKAAAKAIEDAQAAATEAAMIMSQMMLDGAM